MKIYWRIVKYIAKYKLSAFSNLIFTIISVSLYALSISMLHPVIELLFSDGKVVPTEKFAIKSSQFLQNEIIKLVDNYDKITALGVALFVIVLMNLTANIFRFIAATQMNIIRTKVIEDIRNDVFDKVSRLQISYIENNKKGDLLTRMTSDLIEVEKSILISFQSIIRDPFTIAFYLYLMIATSWELTIFIFILLPVSAFLISKIVKSLRKDAYQTQSILSSITSLLDEFTSGIRIVKAFNAEDYARKIFRKLNWRYSFYSKKQFNKHDMAQPVSETMGIITMALFIWFGGKMIFAGEFAAAGIFVFILYFQQIMKPAKNITNAASNINKGIASADRVFELKDAEVIIKERKDAKNIKLFEKSIDFKSITFSYEAADLKEVEVLKNINISIPKGKMYALVGPSGSGKTTFVELLLRFYDTKKGGIYIDGIDIKDLKIKDLRSMMAIVTQDPILFNDTIFSNIAFSKNNISEEDVINAAKAANAHQFISQTEQGYQTIVGDRGVLLSGGQRQRISIARAILQNPDILILDEATSALDTASEKIVQKALNNLMKNRTSIVIAHRLSTIHNADKIIVLDKGKIVEVGTHEELLETQGLYSKLYNMQQYQN